MKRIVPLLFVVCGVVAGPASGASSAICNAILMKHGAFNLIVEEGTKSATENVFEWLRTATWEEFKKKQDAGLRLVLPIEGVPVQADGTYSEASFRNFVELRDQGKLRNFTHDEFDRSVRLTASKTIADTWLDCVRINQDPKGMTCWAEADDRLANGTVVLKARYFTDRKSDTEPVVPSQGGLYVDGGQVVTPNPLGPGKTVPFGGVAVRIKRDGKSRVMVSLNSEDRGPCNSVVFDAIGDEFPPFKIAVFANTSQPAGHPEITVPLPKDYKLIGGGAHVNWRGAGNLLVASFPNGNSWTARSKDHRESDPAPITAWAIGLYDPESQWDVEVRSKSVATSGGLHGSVTIDDLPAGFVRTGGGAKSEPGGNGRLLIASYPEGSTGWTVKDKDHEYAQAGMLSAYVIGIKHRTGPTPEPKISTAIGSSAAHPTGSVSFDPSYVVTGGGARVQCAQGSLLTGSFPHGTTTWRAEAKDHFVSCPSTIDVWAIGIKPPDGSIISDEAGLGLEQVRNFRGAMAIAPGKDPAVRVLAENSGSKSRVYITRPGDTYLSLSLRFYSDANYQRLVNANPNVVSNGPLIPAGTRIQLPSEVTK